MDNELLAKIAQSLVDGEPDATYELTGQALGTGLEPLVIIRQGLMPGMNKVGEYFATGEYFLPDLIIAANGMQKAMALLEPELTARQQALESPGTIVIGTVKGDIHEIGKSNDVKIPDNCISRASFSWGGRLRTRSSSRIVSNRFFTFRPA